MDFRSVLDIVPTLLSIVTILIVWKKMPSEIQAQKAHTASENVQAASTLADASAKWLDSYNAVFNELRARDEAMVVMRTTLEAEREKRIAAESALAEALRTIEHLKGIVSKLQATAAPESITPQTP